MYAVTSRPNTVNIGNLRLELPPQDLKDLCEPWLENIGDLVLT
jgi:hypothetical protein